MSNSKLIDTKFTVTSINTGFITLCIDPLTYLDNEIYRSIASNLKLTILDSHPTLSFLIYSDSEHPNPDKTEKIEFAWGSDASPLYTNLASKYALVRTGVLNACLNIGFDYSTPVLDTPDSVHIGDTLFNITTIRPQYQGYSEVKAPLSINGGVKKKNFDSQIVAQEVKQLMLSGEAWKPLLETELPQHSTELPQPSTELPLDPEPIKETPQEKALREFLESVVGK